MCFQSFCKCRYLINKQCSSTCLFNLVIFFWIHSASSSILREQMQTMCGRKVQREPKRVFDVSIGFSHRTLGLHIQRWFWGPWTPPLSDTSTISLWPLPAGGRLISLNHISLEGATFSEAAEVIHSSPEEVQLIISQPKGALCVCLLLCTVTVNLAFLCLSVMLLS